jgi:hypothetical protein
MATNSGDNSIIQMNWELIYHGRGDIGDGSCRDHDSSEFRRQVAVSR